MNRDVKPMGALAIPKDKLNPLYEDPNYIAEKKYDGSRYILQVTEEGITLTSRRESVQGGMVNKTQNIPQIINEAKQLPIGTILDGEIDVPGDKRNFKYVQGVMGSLPERAIELQQNNISLVYKVFDILEFQGNDLRNKTLKERKNILGWLSEQHNFYFIQVVEVCQTEDEKRNLYKSEIALGAEGIMLKNLNSIYTEDKKPSHTWYKVKRTATYDGIVKGYEFGAPGTKYENMLGTLTTYQYKDGDLINTAEVSGLSEQERIEFKKRLDNGEEFIIEFKAQETVGDHKYRYPHFVRIRTDKNPKECIYGKS